MPESNLHQIDKHDGGTEPFTTFKFGDQTVRAIIDGGEPWFVRRDVLALLDLRSNTSARSLPPDELRTHTMRTKGKLRDFAMVNEPGLYRLVFQSRKQEAEDIKTWVFTEVLPEIRAKGYYARPGALPVVEAGVLTEVSQLGRQLAETQLAIANQVGELVKLQKQAIEVERAKAALARFPNISEVPRGEVRGKLCEMIDVVATARGWCSSRVWHELYLTVRRKRGIDLHANRAATRRTCGRWVPIIQCIESWGLLDVVYTVAVAHFTDDIVARPKQSRVAELLVAEELPTEQEKADEWVHEYMMGRLPPEAYEPEDPSSIN